VEHPTLNGKPVSARDPRILDKSGIGELFHTRIENKLISEAWIDVKKTERVDKRILNNLRTGKPIEVSTGLGTENELASEGSVHDDGKPYTHIARNYRPDHLAVLPDTVGACSVQDGCGLLINTAMLSGFTSHDNGHEHMTFVDSKTGDGWASNKDGHMHFIDNFRVSRGDTDHNHKLPKENLVDTGIRNSKTSNTKDFTMDETKKKAIIDDLIANESICCWTEEDRPTLEALTDNHLERLDKNVKEVTANETRQEVVVNELKKTHTLDDKSGVWTVNTPKPKKEPVVKPTAPTTNKQPTEEEWLESAPQSVKDQLSFANNEMDRQKDEAVTLLIANVAEADQESHRERLMGRTLADLQEDVRLLPAKPATTVNYSGQAGAPTGAPTTNQKNFPQFGLPGEYPGTRQTVDTK
jgi:hypothetical protein